MKNDLHTDGFIDEISTEIAAESLPDAVVDNAVRRVWKRLGSTGSGDRPISSCAEYQALIPSFLSGDLEGGRRVLFEDHMKECVPCRRALMDARTGGDRPVQAERRRHTPRYRLAAVAMAVVAIGAVLLLTHVFENRMINRDLRATIEQIEGSVQLVGEKAVQSLPEGSEIRADQVLRTSKNSGAVIRLADSSTIEMNQRSEIHLHASTRGTMITLERGDIIVHAAKKKNGRLYVDAGQCEIAVKGTVFSVAHGLKGSRVSVFRGEVEVRQGSTRTALLPGEQLTTTSGLARVPLEEEISWSRDAEFHRALLAELGRLNHDMARAADRITKRSSTRLLDLVPPETLIYAGLPNLAGSLSEAREILHAHLSESPVLGRWWDDTIVSKGIDRKIDDILDRISSLGEPVGDEIVVAVTASALEGRGGPLILAELEDPATFRVRLEAEISRVNEESGVEQGLILVSDPFVDEIPGDHLYLLIHDDIFAAAFTPGDLVAFVASADDRNPFIGTALHADLARNYAPGVEWIFGLDLHKVTAGAIRNAPERAQLFDQLGLLDAGVLIVRHESEDLVGRTSAELNFTGLRHGITAFLAEPAPMGSLDFISPEATMVAAAVTMDAAGMLDELIHLLAQYNPEALDDLRTFEAGHAIDFRNDLARTLGGEAAFALDGPLFPTPAWKFIVEVYDPAGLEAGIEKIIAEANRELEAREVETRVVVEKSEFEGRRYVSIGLEGAPARLCYTIADGFLLAGPNAAVVRRAVDLKDSGTTLSTSGSFRGLFPASPYTDCSALYYLDASALVELVDRQGSGLIPPETAELLRQVARQRLFCVYGESDRIVFESMGSSPFGLAPLLLLGDIIDPVECKHTPGSGV